MESDKYDKSYRLSSSCKLPPLRPSKSFDLASQSRKQSNNIKQEPLQTLTYSTNSQKVYDMSERRLKVMIPGKEKSARSDLEAKGGFQSSLVRPKKIYGVDIKGESC